MKYRKKPVVIEAIQYTGLNATECLKFMFPDIEPEAEASLKTIKTLEGEMQVKPNDYIIRGIQGELYPCKPDIFEATYEKIDTAENYIEDESDCKLIECTKCGEVLNGKSLWITEHGKTVCEKCHEN